MMIDVDHFKRINDTKGHAGGDQVLRVVAQALLKTARTSDVVCRYGGEEFAVILPVTSIDSAAQLARRICDDMPSLCARAGVATAAPVTVTIGVAAYPNDGSEAADLLRVADRRLYQGKEDGRNRILAA